MRTPPRSRWLARLALAGGLFLGPSLQGEIVDHPAFAPYVDDSVAWQSLGAESFEFSDDESGLLLLFCTPQYPRPGRVERIHRVFTAEGFAELVEGYRVALASPAWWWLFEQRCIFSNGTDLDSTIPGIVCGDAPILLFNEDAEIVGFQVPGYTNYTSEDFEEFLTVYSNRHEESPNVSGHYSGLARARRNEVLLEGLGEGRDTSSIAALAGSLMAASRTNQSARTLPGLLPLRTLRLVGNLQLAAHFREHLLNSAAKALDDSWESLDAEGAELFASRSIGAAISTTEPQEISLESNCLILLAEAGLTNRSEQRRERARRLLDTVEKRFVADDGTVSEFLYPNEQEELIPCGWSRLDALALLAQVRLLWDVDPETSPWLANQARQLLEADELPASIEPALPGEPVSPRGIALLGEAFLMAADLAGDSEASQRWLSASSALFDLFEERYGVGKPGYRILPEDHPLDILPIYLFADLREPSIVGTLGDWLRGLEAHGVDRAGSRADELEAAMDDWRASQSEPIQDHLLLQVLSLRKPSGEPLPAVNPAPVESGLVLDPEPEP